jgi:hypothetical protein
MHMTLRFQKDDEVDREVKAGRRRFPIWTFVFLFILLGVISGIAALIHGWSLVRLERELGEILGFSFFVALGASIFAPLYKEFRFRTKEIDGKVLAIEEALTASREVEKAMTVSRIEWTVNDTRENLAGLLERFNEIEKKLDAIERHLGVPRSSVARTAYRFPFPPDIPNE